LPEALPQNIACSLVLANILAAPLMENAAAFAAYVAPGGRLVLSGILTEQAADVVAAYTPWLSFVEQQAQEGWVRLVFSAM
jgi:ribosomal protein L11 methyltransferase